ncbi:MAG: alanine/glycine:cation symporter family protein [Rubrobacteraceae bacterium]
MGAVEVLVAGINNLLWTYILIVMLIGAGLYFTIRSDFVQFRLIGEMFRVIADTSRGPSGQGISSFGAFCIGAASRIGTGNLAGVALAIAIGGPGAVFWMWVIALIGAASAFVESTLAQIYKVPDGQQFRGGPAYYMEKALGQRWMGILFAILITFTFGLVFNSVQANTISLAFESAYGVPQIVLAVLLTVFAALVIFGGVRRISNVAQVLVPVMAVIYVLMALYIILINFTQIPAVIWLIISDAFGLREAIGGGIWIAMMQGIRRGLFSNEAGMGSAPNAAATASVTHPAKQGLVQTLGVFTDTLLVATATAFIILFSGVYDTGETQGITLTQDALATQIGGWAPSFIAVAILMFAFSSIIGNYYYGETNIEFITEDRRWVFYYRIAVLMLVFFGSVAALELVWALADMFMGSMAVVNLIAILLLAPIAFAALNDYLRQRRAGQDPVFHVDSIRGLRNVECWGESKKNVR